MTPSEHSPAPPPALAGLRGEMTVPSAGLLSWYQDGPARPGTQRPLLLVHSVNAAGSAYEVKPLYDHFRASRPVYALDLPGFGLSERSRRPYAPRLMTDAVHALVAEIRRAHGDLPVDAIALSLGCEFLARAAAETPGAYRSLGLVSPTGLNDVELRAGAPGSDLGMPRLYAAMAGPRVGRWLFSQLTRRSVIAYFLRRTWGAPGIDGGLLEYDYAVTRGPGAEHAPLRFLCGFLFSGDSGTVYRAVRAPVWVAHGVRGDFVRYQGLARLRAEQGWTVEVLPTGALPHFEMLPQFLSRYGAWSERLPG